MSLVAVFIPTSAANVPPAPSPSTLSTLSTTLHTRHPDHPTQPETMATKLTSASTPSTAASTSKEYQAEAALKVGATTETKNSGYTGAGYADFQHATGDYIQWNVTVSAKAAYVLQWRYANGGTDRPVTLAINGIVRAVKVSMPPLAGWSKWRSTAVTASLNTGTNTIRLTAAGQSGANIDKLTVMKAPAGSFTFPGAYQVENGKLAGAIKDTKNAGYTGTGYVDFVHQRGDSLTMTVQANATAPHMIIIRYAYSGEADRPMKFAVNGATPRVLSLPPTGSFSKWKEAITLVSLRKGSNTLVFTTTGASGPNIDRLLIKR